ncbi:hypothetical protein ACIBAG_12695 [Streptomyces sp. NPDC051243]|uniref:DUF3558 domain-containing protein n=1 Tax=Streptomyces cyaneochromogenes TaxID=2496836 RepID=A0A3S9MB13_9ACTN|nr:hypothetical protein [Streptomyces cyaneochromogenes]AZQ36275.1 hypothetical protein EJ357_24765 [Streptomyces cyaneochromogenes]
MHSRRLPRTALPAAAAVLCALLASCSSGNASSDAAASPSGAGQVTTVSPEPTATPAVTSSPKTLPPSHLCTVLDRSAARQVLTDPKQAPRLAPDKGTAPDSCSYTSGDGTAMLTLNPSARSYDAEVSASHNLVRDPASAGMRDVKVTEVTGLGQGAFSETVQVVQPKQDVAYVVWRAGSKVWVLTLAETAGAKGADRLVSLARQITPRLPH